MSAGSLSAAEDLRRLLYGDVPIATWANGDQLVGAARDALATGDEAAARTVLLALLAEPERASRDRLQAWHVLRRLGVAPPDPGRLYGVVIDMPVSNGRDTLAAYDDLSCRYINQSGQILIWDARRDDIDAQIRAVLAAGSSIVARIGPWDGPRPPLGPHTLRLSMLCAGGLYFGEGPVSGLSSDPMAGPLIAAATDLLQTLIAL
jgi:hypothetical protein